MTEPSVFDQLRPLYDALVGGHYVLTGALAVVILVGLFRKLGSPNSWVYSNPGGTALAMITATASAMAITLGAPGVAFTWGILRTSLIVGVSAAGGYAVLKNLLVDPILRPLAAKAPGWLQPLFSLLFYVFDKPSAVAQAEAVGTDAVVANPGTGVSAVTGQPTDIK